MRKALVVSAFLLLVVPTLLLAQTDKVTICHNENHNSMTITVNESALPAHLAHGDSIGPCSVEPPPPPPPVPACSDGKDNDGDGLVDMADPGCSSPDDNDEYNSTPKPPPPPPTPTPTPTEDLQEAPKVVGFTIDPNFVLTGEAGETIVFRIVYILDDDTSVVDQYLLPFKASISKATMEEPQFWCSANVCRAKSDKNGFFTVEVTLLGVTKTVGVNFLSATPRSTTVEPIIVVPSSLQGNPGETVTARVNLPHSFQVLSNSGLYRLQTKYGRHTIKESSSLFNGATQGQQVNIFSWPVTGLTEDGPMGLKVELFDPFGIKIAEGARSLWAKFGSQPIKSTVAMRQSLDPSRLMKLIVIPATDSASVSWQEIVLLLGGKFYMSLPASRDSDGSIVFTADNLGYPSFLLSNFYYDVALIGKNAQGAWVTEVQPKGLWLSENLVIVH